MGILNVTPDSFSDGGAYDSTELAARHGLELVASGAHIIDVGGESTRPGSDPVCVDVELSRTIPVVRMLSATTEAALSIDTTKAKVALEATAAGAHIINDVSAGLVDENMFSVAAQTKAGLVLMHMRGRPKTMQLGDIVYDDVVTDVLHFLEKRMVAAVKAGVKEEAICLDPSIGFGKTVDQNLTLIARLDEFRSLGRPILLGASRKSFLGKLTGRSVGQRGLRQLHPLQSELARGKHSPRT